MRIHCTVRRSATRIHCTVHAINSQCAVRAVNIHVWSDSIASPFCHLFAWKFFPEWKHFVVSINVPPPQLWGGQHTEMFVNHVTVFSQSVSHIRLSHTIYNNILYCALQYNTQNMHNSYYIALISRWVFNLVLNSFTVADFLTKRGRLFHNLGTAYMNALSPRIIFDFPEGYFNNVWSWELRMR